MRPGLIAQKLGMSAIFTPQGERVPVTLLKVDGCVIVAKKTNKQNGQSSLVVGFGDAKPQKVSKSLKTVFANAGVTPKKKLAEFKVASLEKYNVGDTLPVGHFSEGQLVDVTGTSIGKGFAGVMKRHNFRGLEASHGVSISHRSHGSTGQRQDPGKVFKGKKMAGHLGDERITIQNLKVILIDAEKGFIGLKGAVPGRKGSVLIIKDAIKASLNDTGNKNN